MQPLVAEQQQQVGEVQAQARPCRGHTRLHGGRAIFGTAEGEQGARPRLQAGGLARDQRQGAVRVVQRPARFTTAKVDLGQAVLQGVFEAGTGDRREVGAGLQVVQRFVESPQLAQGRAPDPAGVGGPGCDLQDLVGEARCGRPVVPQVCLEQQLGRRGQLRGRGSRRHPLEHRPGLFYPGQPVQGPDTTPQGGQHADEIDPDLDRFALRVSGEHVGGEVPGARGGAHVALDRRGQQLIGQLQRGRVAAVLVEQVQQEGHLEAPAPDRVVEAAPDPVLALVLPGQGEQRPGLELCALVLAGIDGQGLLRILQREVRFSSFEVELGQGVVYGVAEVST